MNKDNLKRALQRACIAGDYPEVAKAAQAIFEAGFELEEVGYSDSMFAIVCEQVVRSGWVPKLTDKMIADIENEDAHADAE